MTAEEKRIVEGLIARDEAVTREVFYVKGRVLLINAIRRAGGNLDAYDDHVARLLIHLLENGARRLRLFAGTDSVAEGDPRAFFGWLQSVAGRLFMEGEQRERRIHEDLEDIYDREGRHRRDMPGRRDAEPMVCEDVDVLLGLMPTARYREFIRMHYIEEMDFDDIAKATGEKKDNLYNLNKRAMDQLREIAAMESRATRIASARGGLCAILCEQYVLDVFGIHNELDSMQLTAKDGGWLDDNGLARDDIGRFASDMGLSVAASAMTLEGVRAALDGGAQVMAVVDGGELTGNLMLERLEDEMGYKIPDHCVAVLAVDLEAGVTLYDPAYGEMPLMMPTSRFLDAWEDSGNFAVVVR